MISRGELKEFILKNCVNENGDIYLSKLDFSDFDGDVYIDSWKVKRNLVQKWQKVGEDLYQDTQKVGKKLYQDNQEVK